MALQSNLVAVLSLFVVVLIVGATICIAENPKPIVSHKLSTYNDELVQSIAKFGVEEYNKAMKGTSSHLFFMQVVGGYVQETEPGGPYGWTRYWYLEIKAKNCSEPGPPALYGAGLFDRLWGSPTHVRGNDFWLGGIEKSRL